MSPHNIGAFVGAGTLRVIPHANATWTIKGHSIPSHPGPPSSNHRFWWNFTHINFDLIHRAMQNFISVLQIVSEIWFFKLVTPWTLSRLKFRLFLCRFWGPITAQLWKWAFPYFNNLLSLVGICKIQDNRFILEILFLYEWCQNGVLTNFYLKYLAAQQGFFHLKKHIFFNSL